ncbi:hypothetical protein AMATHDRAFT_137824 [Amanita thiersii Skay4041]|uniref:Glycoside hydrolase family 76 protein n=1 Tax=Amanita thiersii Skay4041 TaxID=703135 RepID=A0A2A9NT02_9AGAR|nr:hypothetical protein AMATHDRAFT_137824 [Amanita thiersii Skay4041]
MLFCASAISLVLLALQPCVAQDLGVPLSWREFSNSRSLSQRISISQNAINAILPQLSQSTAEFNGIGYWQSGNVFSAMANHDHVSGTSTFRTQVVNNLNTAFSLHAHYDKFHSHIRISGLRRLELAKSCNRYLESRFELVSINQKGVQLVLSLSSVVTQQNANSGSIPTKNFGLAGTCDGITMAGGVFWRPTIDDQAINSVTTGLYITASAYLAEITGDSKYRDAAILSAQWIKNHNINPNNIVLDTVNGHDCSRSPSTWLFTYNSGKYIEGLSVLADVTGDNSWRTLMINIAAAAMKNAPWQGSDGIITEGSNTSSNNDGVGFKAIYIRGLYEAFSRNPSNTNLRILIHSYVDDIQYNALLELAANGNFYSANWHGPPMSFTTWGQLAALDPLVAAIGAN